METIPEFEYDEAKSRANLDKHGIDFEEAQHLWQDERALVIASRNIPEPRMLRVGLVNGRAWTAVFTRRQHCVRLISVRRARKMELQAYVSQDYQR